MNIALFASGSSGNCALRVRRRDTYSDRRAGISAQAAHLRGTHLRRMLRRPTAGGRTRDARALRPCCGPGSRLAAARDPTAVYALPAVCAALRKLLPERTDCLHEIAPGEPFCLGDVRVTPFPTPHDAAGSCGYRLDGSARFGFAPTSAP
ncbi:MAG: hypothetical protein ACLSHG_13365 [Oscillospiraceae bacterium]